jgi:hypothetical protein
LSKKSGVISSYKFKGSEFIYGKGGPRLNVYRAPIVNDRGASVAWRKNGLDNLLPKVEKIETVTLKNMVRVMVSQRYEGKNNSGFDVSTTYNVLSNGEVLVDVHTVPFGNLPTLARMGMKMSIPEEFEKVNFLGRGPHENYCDRKASAHVDMYNSTVTDQYVPYGEPQDNGSRQDTRWLALSDDSGGGLMFVAEGKTFAFSALPYTIENLEKGEHLNEVELAGFTTLCIKYSRIFIEGECRRSYSYCI